MNRAQDMAETDPLEHYWARPAAEVATTIGAGTAGLSQAEAAGRLARYGPNRMDGAEGTSLWQLLAVRLKSPLLLILVFAALIALVVKDWLEASIILAIIAISSALGTQQEYRAGTAVSELRRRIALRATALRDGVDTVLPAADIVPGDVIRLSAGSLVPADCLLIEARDLYASQAALTGETLPVEKQPGIVAAGATPAERYNCVFLGTSIRSGTATALVVRTGYATSLGEVAKSINRAPEETEFERGLRQFGIELMRIMVLIVLAVLTINVVMERPGLDSLLFAIALAVGISPEMLPAILAVTLSHGAMKLSRHGVIVRHTGSIENLGSMDVLCCDKTGTLTRGSVDLDRAADCDGNADLRVLQLAWLNANMQTGLQNALDEAIVAAGDAACLNARGAVKCDEIPYDFSRKRLSIVVRDAAQGRARMITKGALREILGSCDRALIDGAEHALDAAIRERFDTLFAAWTEDGFRVLGIAEKQLLPADRYSAADETAMLFRGFLLFLDPPEPEVAETLAALGQLGVSVKMITGDNRLVAAHVARAVGMDTARVLCGAEITAMKDEALTRLARDTAVFAEIEPNQKERIVRALQQGGRVVGYLGDGINDAPALHTADVGISVDSAVDVARDAADMVLLKHDLGVIREGIDEGRHTLANTLKYIYITTSANFGNMISMAAATLFLPFLPMLATQILLNNLLSDIPSLSIAGDNVDREWELTPHRWNIGFIRGYMVIFGLISALFDLVTFGLLWLMVGDTPVLFRTGWFVESLLTELLVLFVMRTYKPFYRSRPGRMLIVLSVIVIAITLALPYLPLVSVLGFAPLPPAVLATVLVIAALYTAATEAAKLRYRRYFT
jgi:Mg2+-importing ATPase